MKERDCYDTDSPRAPAAAAAAPPAAAAVEWLGPPHPLPEYRDHLLDGPTTTARALCVAKLEYYAKSDKIGWNNLACVEVPAPADGSGTATRGNFFSAPSPVRGVKCKLFKCIWEFFGRSLEEVYAAAITDRMVWDYNMAEHRILEQRTPTHAVGLWVTKKNFGIDRRAFYDLEFTWPKPDGTLWCFGKTIDFKPGEPLPASVGKVSNYTRGYNHPGSGWVFEPFEAGESVTGNGTGVGAGGGVRVTMAVLSDIKGWVPTSLVNSSIPKHNIWMMKTLAKHMNSKPRPRRTRSSRSSDDKDDGSGSGNDVPAMRR